MQIQMNPQAFMTMVSSGFRQMAENPAADVVINLPGDAQAESQNLMFRRALNAIGHDECLCDDDDALCPACLAKGMLEPMAAGRVAEVFHVPLGAVPSVAGAGGRIFDNDDDD